ncbi:MAG: tetratricopeptide repeat protein [Candidatus Lokiarchaeota archaeon]|nr:tetratricopeptide repeat protein [Candidatus Lokiarchaeota archaeon]
MPSGLRRKEEITPKNRAPIQDPGNDPGVQGLAGPDRERQVGPCVPNAANFSLRDARFRYRVTILERAVDPAALESLVLWAGIERDVLGQGAAEIAARTGFRVREVAGTPYILCPVPSLHDPKRGVESGFAVDVNRHRFAVHAYMHDRAADEYFIASKLARRACRPLAVPAKSIGKIRALANEVSAVLFVNSIVADAAAGSDAPQGQFASDPYAQLVDCLASVTGPRWINRAAIGRRFERVMGLLETLDAAHPLHENNKRRAFLGLVRFLYGDTRFVTGHKFPRFLEPAAIKRHEGAIRAYVESAEFLRFLEGCGYLESPVGGLLELFARGGLRISGEFGTHLIDFIQERAVRNSYSPGLEDVVEVGRHPDYATLYQRAAGLAADRLGPNHETTKQLRAHLEACKLSIERHAGASGKEYEARLQAMVDVVSKAGAECIPFDQVDVMGVPDKAIGIVLDGIDSMADRPEAALAIGDASKWFRLGRVFDNVSTKPDAAFCYKAAIAHRPSHSLAWYNLHIAYDDAGDFIEARRCVDIALRENPFNPHAWNALGVFERNAGKFAEAELCFRTSLSLKEDIEADPAVVETRVSPRLWEIVEDNLHRLPDKEPERRDAQSPPR